MAQNYRLKLLGKDKPNFLKSLSSIFGRYVSRYLGARSLYYFIAAL